MLISIALTVAAIIHWLLQPGNEPTTSLLLACLSLILCGRVASNGIKLGFFKDTENGE
jgi:hypothetical protein